MLIGLSGSPVPTHLFQTLAEQAVTVMPHDYLAVCLEDADQQGYLVHSLSTLPGEPIATRVFTHDEGLPGRTIRTGRAHLVGELERIADGAPDLDGVLARAGLQAALAVPLRRGPQVLGALLFARQSAPYTLDDLEIAGLLAAGVSGALETCRAYQSLADERGTLASVLTSTADAVVMVGQDGLVLLVDPAARAMLGLSPETAVGRPFPEALAHEPLRRLLSWGSPGSWSWPARRRHRAGEPGLRDHGVRRAGRPRRDPARHHLAQEPGADEERLREHRLPRPQEPDHGHRDDRRAAGQDGAAHRGRRPSRSLSAHPAKRGADDRARDRPAGPRQDRGRPRGAGRAARPGRDDRRGDPGPGRAGGGQAHRGLAAGSVRRARGRGAGAPRPGAR